MPSITDTRGTVYELRLTVPLIRKVKSQLGVNLTHLEGDPLNTLANDPELFVNCLWLLCRSQFETDPDATDEDGERIRPDEQFAYLLPPDVLDQASAALLDAIIDFFPSGKRSALRSLATTLERKRTMATAQMIERLNDPAMEQRVITAAVNSGMEALEKRLNLEATDTSDSGPPIAVSSWTDGMP